MRNWATPLLILAPVAAFLGLTGTAGLQLLLAAFLVVALVMIVAGGMLFLGSDARMSAAVAKPKPRSAVGEVSEAV